MTDDAQPPIAEYRLRLDIDFDGLAWQGSVEFDRPAGSRRWALDCEGPKVDSVRAGGAPVPFAVDEATHRLNFELPGSGTGPVAIHFTGKVETQNLFGLYRSRHGDGHVLTSHCEPTGARRIFPCVDRPDRKARFALTVRAPAGLEVISNTPGRRTGPENGTAEWTFDPTPEMSTYLFYLGVGRFDLREDEGGTPSVRVATPPGRGDAGAWALRSARRILRAYETYYGIPYPLPKLDLIAIAEHAFGAMENWGAISFQESRLLIDGASSSFATRDVFETTAHEIAHQWFGNLVTMGWWDDIWLNESFAALMETKITAELEPGFDPWCDFFVRTAGKAMAVDGDSLRSTHPVRAHVQSPEELSQIFDEISYGKGSTVLAMLDRYLGEAAFRAGVTEYLKRFSYRNASTADLFASLERASGEPVGALAGPWIDRAGIPMIRAQSTAGGVRLRQSRFTFHGEVDEPPWPIPLVVEVDGRRQKLLFDQREHELAVPSTATVVLNPDSIGFFRVLYDGPLLDRLLASLPTKPGKDGWALLDDLAAFLESGDTDWATYATAVRRFADSSERLVVETLAGTLAGFAMSFPHVPGITSVAREFLARQCDRIGIDRRENEPMGTGVLRDRLAFARVRVDEAFAAGLAGRFAGWEQLDPDLRTSVAIAQARAGGDAGYEQLRAAQERAKTAIEALRMERALAWSPRAQRVREVLDLCTAGKINRSHVLGVAIQASMNPVARETTWAWLQAELETLTGFFRGSGYLPLLLEMTLPQVGAGRAEEVRRFFDAHPTPEGTRGLAKGLERLEIAERLRRRLG